MTRFNDATTPHTGQTAGDGRHGYYKLSWGERIGFNSGELAQNLIYQTVSIWLLFPSWPCW
jgi:hypothetical protein